MKWVFLESRGKECEGRAGGREVGMSLIQGRSLQLELGHPTARRTDLPMKGQWWAWAMGRLLGHPLRRLRLLSPLCEFLFNRLV